MKKKTPKYTKVLRDSEPAVIKPTKMIDVCNIHSLLATLSPHLIYALSKSMKYKEPEFFNVPEKLLLLAVLNRGVKDLAGDLEILITPEAAWDSAIEFFFESDQDYICSFFYCCEWLDINPTLFLKAVIHRLEEKFGEKYN